MDREGTSSPSSASGLTDAQQRAGATRSKATVRASLACVPCRSKHVKCDSALPACLRCRLEEKTCYYAKSRRGIRDPKKRSLINDPVAPPSTSTEASSSFPSPELGSFDVPVNVVEKLPGGWSMRRDVQLSDPRAASPTAFLFDLYFANFHDTHPWLLPKPQLLSHVGADPQPFQFLASCIAFVGSLFSNAISSEELREKAFSLASGSLPMTPWTVQGLLVLSVAAFGENRTDLSGGWMDAATQMALDLGLHKRSFADAEPDAFVAESFRRTYWALYFHGNMRAMREDSASFTLFRVPATTGLPCEEWEYQSGDIPEALSLAQYDSRNPMEERSYSSWTYLIDLCRLSGELIMPLVILPPEIVAKSVDRADSRIVSWLISLPKWKQQLVDSSGAVDMILFHAMAYAHGLRIRMQLPTGALGLEIRDLLALGPLFKSRETSPSLTPRSNWLTCSTALQAGLSIVGLFNFSLPPARYSPALIIGLRRAAIPLLEAGIYGASESSALREKLDLLLGVLKVAGDRWPLARDIGTEVGEVMRDTNTSDYFLGSTATSHFDNTLDAFINDTSTGRRTEDYDAFVFPESKAVDHILQWTTGITGTFQV
ncbi:hypothetical protein CTRI78_v003253 [Colletotrichum trifolii]|uniref:Zn(2)-C6 fungal-type domain-containing protein n=1 Tax=Colletotrichum trifolii TaxID=5466 RepID=A0A4R8RSD0_COLTR|nr:hypothetical protein CTRI78_v003253 [Colletotrichum trifolii]